MPPTTHSKLGASSAHRWMNCPGSVALLETVPRRDSVYAARGTAAHFLAEKAMREGRATAYWAGRRILVLRGGCSMLKVGARNDAAHLVDDDMIRGTQTYVDALRQDDAACPGAVKGLESTFDLDWLAPGMNLFGTNDALVGQPFGVLRVYDYKNGRKYVGAESNPQLLYYALGALGPDNPNEYTEVELVIVQPNAEYGPAVKRWRCGVEEVYRWGRDVLLPAALVAAKPDAPCIAGPWCAESFCDAQAVCPALTKRAVEVSRGLFSPVPAERPTALPAPAEMTQAQVLAVLEHGAAVESWISEVRGYALNALQSGQDVTAGRYKVVHGQSRRRYTDAAEERLTATLRAKAYEDPKIVGITRAEKLLADELGWEKAKVKEFMAGITEKPLGNPVLVPADDPRPAIEAPKFTAVDDPDAPDFLDI